MERGAAIRPVRELPATRWRNGLGMTRQVASSSGSEQPDWRISIATVTDGTAFSTFDGYGRAFTPLAAGRISLLQGGVELSPDADGAVRFDGGVAISARVRGGASLAVNVMARTGLHECSRWRTVTGEFVNDDPSIRAVILAGGAVSTLDGVKVSAPAVIEPGSFVQCTRARFLEIHICSTTTDSSLRQGHLA
ncbi:HutD family protein [Salinibacterium sp. SWN1162]|uniref:HutD/Ves family protein n=1 Tax=Salinibacterium sp. SWN1162 TaxID=2792053 RepID=UPI0021070591|nr:HutD family protein [Salinibacterium sp. SWN1162]